MVDCGEQALLPAICQAGPDTLVVAGGFSCQAQIADAGGLAAAPCTRRRS